MRFILLRIITFSFLLSLIGECSTLKGSARGVQRLVEITDQITTALNANRQPDQRVVDPELGPFFIWHRGMGHEGRAFCQGFHCTQRLG
jgi:hypothetical protein